MQSSDGKFGSQRGRVGVLLIHGLCGSPSEIRFVANGLVREGYRVVTPTLAGHGGSEADLLATTWRDWYASAEQGLEELAATCDTVIVGGLSTGAVLSLMLAARHPDKVQGVALYSPTLWLSGRQVPWYVPLFRLIDSKPVANLFRFPVPVHVGIKDQRIRDFIRNAMAAGGTKAAQVSTPGGAVLERRRLADVVIRELDAVTQPVLIMHARDDDYAGLDNATYLQRKIAGPVELVVLDDSFHMVTIDRERHTVLARTAAFVARIAGALAGNGDDTSTAGICPDRVQSAA
ncbi:MAG TPA: alpha/beta fold hydrolase [Hyphomicrobium sp.]|nr:alpha/beta fold hydrolase [Hyphomicrobium sp.]HRO50025.1 alpha/beta fold hydrolase [Hyphomicrobium sp.]